jgi:predicted dehydrogenase/threonine dehydrogenase-like Zn-dependent dehydrogenase
MKQVLVRGGNVLVEEVPAPKVQPGCALVRVRHSLISSGTESGFVASGGTAGLAIKKARDPLNVEKVKRKLATVGIKGTIDIVRDKLLQFQAPGYSTAGVIVDVAADVPGFRAGDRVACAGVGYASHAEYNVVPHNLLTPIPDGVEFEEAAFVTLGAIAMQGVRQAAPTFGETIVVLGLGLLGQLTAQMVRAAGCHVIGCDPIAEKRALAASLGADVTCGPGELPGIVAEWTAGYGADAVVVCAASKESRVTVQALDVCRQKGRVAIVGAVGLDLPREPLYMKELDFRLSCSYGPGRYQPEYEERGLDYPIGYVRWTEGRNMAAFLRMIADKRVRVRELVTTVKPVEDAKAAYDSILGGDPKAVAALIEYPGDETALPATYGLALKSKTAKKGDVRVGVIGAGGFASAYHLPNLAGMKGVSLRAVAARTGKTAKQTGGKFGAAYCTTDYQEILADADIDAVVIATRHNLHAEIALAAAKSGKHIFVEKPLALTVEECEAIVQAVEAAGVLLTVGFNRRFSPFAQAMKQALDGAGGPKNMLYRCNAGALPPNHWAQDPVEGGGRIVGECVHFYDLCCWLAGEDAVDVKASRIGSERSDVAAEDNLSTLLTFPGGSLATIVYTCTGHGGLGKERIEGFAGGGAVVIDDFRGVQFHGLPGKNVSGSKEHKGQAGILENFIQAIRGEAALCVTAADGLRATRIAREALASARGGQK